MRISTTLVTMVLVVGGIAMLAPAVGALDIGCQRADETGTAQVTTLPAGSSTLFTPEGSDILGWTPQCVIIPNGGTVIFSQRDAIGHGALRTGCFELPTMSIANDPTSSINLEFDLDLGIGYTLQNGEFGDDCEDFTLDGDVAIVDYWCRIHGKQMPGRIIVEL